MSAAERRSDAIFNTKLDVYARDGGICQSCGSSVPWPGQLAHVVSQSEANLRKYGAHVIHHKENMRLTCSLECNGHMEIDSDPEAVKAHITNIERNQ